jgi:4-amino-4-deoxy-L-arabinose transferase-like glycosyltransferase
MFSKLISSLSGKKNSLVFILLLALAASFYYESVLDKSPKNMHIWRQTDCLSLARNYAQGANFFEPEMDILLGDDFTSGKTAGEFPILYYSVGMLWKLFGESYLSYRLLGLFLLVCGLFCFYKTLNIIFKNSFWATILALLLFTSPTYAVYGVSFLTDAPAFSLVLIALYFYLRYHKDKKPRLFYFSMLLFAIAGLIKVSSLMAFLFLFFIFLLELVFNKNTLGTKKVSHFPKLELLGFLSVFAMIASWYFYAEHYNGLHRFKYTFNNVYPIWIVEKNEVGALVRNFKDIASIVFFSRPMIYMLVFLGFINLFLYKKISLFPYLANVVIIVGSIMYFILWTPLMGNHDYYYVCLLTLYIGVLVPFVWFVKSNSSPVFDGKILKLFAGVFLLFNFLYCLSVVKLKTGAEEGNFYMVGNHSFVKEMFWTNWDVKNHWDDYKDLSPYLNEIGVKKEDKVISISDKSFNSSLYLMGKKGWTGFYFTRTQDEINQLINKGAKYLIIRKTDEAEREYMQPYFANLVGQHRGLNIYKLVENS